MRKIFYIISLILLSQMNIHAMQNNKYIQGISFRDSKDCKNFYNAIITYLNQNNFKQKDRVLAEFDSKNNQLFKLHYKDFRNFIYIFHSSKLKEIILCGVIDNILQNEINSFLNYLKKNIIAGNIEFKIEVIAFESNGQQFNAYLCIPIDKTINYKNIFVVVFDFIKAKNSNLTFLIKNVNINLQGKQCFLEDIQSYKFQLLFTCDIHKFENNQTFSSTIVKILNLTISQLNEIKSNK